MVHFAVSVGLITLLLTQLHVVNDSESVWMPILYKPAVTSGFRAFWLLEGEHQEHI